MKKKVIISIAVVAALIGTGFATSNLVFNNQLNGYTQTFGPKDVDTEVKNNIVVSGITVDKVVGNVNFAVAENSTSTVKFEGVKAVSENDNKLVGAKYNVYDLIEDPDLLTMDNKTEVLDTLNLHIEVVPGKIENEEFTPLTDGKEDNDEDNALSNYMQFFNFPKMWVSYEDWLHIDCKNNGFDFSYTLGWASTYEGKSLVEYLKDEGKGSEEIQAYVTDVFAHATQGVKLKFVLTLGEAGDEANQIKPVVVDKTDAITVTGGTIKMGETPFISGEKLEIGKDYTFTVVLANDEILNGVTLKAGEGEAQVLTANDNGEYTLTGLVKDTAYVIAINIVKGAIITIEDVDFDGVLVKLKNAASLEEVQPGLLPEDSYIVEVNGVPTTHEAKIKYNVDNGEYTNYEEHLTTNSGHSYNIKVEVTEKAKDPKEVSVTLSEKGYSNQQEISSVSLDEFISLSFDKGSNSLAPKYYTSGTAVRLYPNNIFTFSANNVKISKIEINYAGSDNDNKAIVTCDKDGYSESNLVGTWQSQTLETSVSFTLGGEVGKQKRLGTITVTYIPD